jgi:phage tail tape-measure protein
MSFLIGLNTLETMPGKFNTEIKGATTSLSGMNARLNATSKRLSNWGTTTSQAAEGLKKVKDQMDGVIRSQQLISRPVRSEQPQGRGGSGGGTDRFTAAPHRGGGRENGVFSGLRGNIFLLGEIGDAARTVTDILFGWRSRS